MFTGRQTKSKERGVVGIQTDRQVYRDRDWQTKRKKEEFHIDIKLMGLGSPNWIDVVKSNLKSEFDCWISSIRISTIKIESTIAISDINQNKINLFPIKSTIFDIKSIFNWFKWIKCRSFNQKLSNYIKNCRIWSKMVEFDWKSWKWRPKLTIFDQIRNFLYKFESKSNIDMNFESISLWR